MRATIYTMQHGVLLLDAQGNRLTEWASRAKRKADILTITKEFRQVRNDFMPPSLSPSPGMPYKVVINVVSAVKRVKVPFDFRNVTLP